MKFHQNTQIISDMKYMKMSKSPEEHEVLCKQYLCAFVRRVVCSIAAQFTHHLYFNSHSGHDYQNTTKLVKDFSLYGYPLLLLLHVVFVRMFSSLHGSFVKSDPRVSDLAIFVM